MKERMPMQISSRVRHSTRLLMTLAHCTKKEPLRAASLSSNIGISAKYMEKIIKPLRQAGIIKGLRGRGGGYFLGRTTKEITLGEIVRAVDGGVHLTSCVDPDRCSPLDYCGSPTLWAGVSNSLESKLNAITLAELMQEPASGHALSGTVRDAPIKDDARAA